MEDGLTNLQQMTVIVTGANAGIGRETAAEIARRGARVILACRNQQRAEAARQSIVEETGNSNVDVKMLDLASLESVRQFAEDIRENEERLDILINNAGVVSKDRSETEEGYELHFGVNHLGHFLLTHLLLDKLRSCAPSRVVTVSSGLHRHRSGYIDFADLQMEKFYSPLIAYARSKTANILFTSQLAKYMEGSGVCAFSLHPGAVETNIAQDFCVFNNKLTRWCAKAFINFFARLFSAREAALKVVYCATQPDIEHLSGSYFSRNSNVYEPRFHARDPEAAIRLWNVSMQLTGLAQATDDLCDNSSAASTKSVTCCARCFMPILIGCTDFDS